MKLLWTYKLLLLFLLSNVLQINGQNTITIKKSYPTISAIFKSTAHTSKVNYYYCFKKNGHVYYFSSGLKEKHIIQNCKQQQWLKTNSSTGKYLYYQDSITISPITYNMYGEETTNDFFYLAILDSTELKVTAVGKTKSQDFRLLYPIPMVITE